MIGTVQGHVVHYAIGTVHIRIGELITFRLFCFLVHDFRLPFLLLFEIPPDIHDHDFLDSV